MPNKPKTNQPETPNEVQGRDLFQTPNYALDLLYPFIPRRIDTVWECAAGNGKIVKWLDFNNYEVVATDINGLWRNFNFLSDYDYSLFFLPNAAIITNPPFSLKSKFFLQCLEYGYPFALLVPADYSMWTIDAVRKFGCQKLVPTRRIDYITPNMLEIINTKLPATYNSLYEIPGKILAKFTSGKFHSMWLCKGFDLPEQETFVELTLEDKKNI